MAAVADKRYSHGRVGNVPIGSVQRADSYSISTVCVLVTSEVHILAIGRKSRMGSVSTRHFQIFTLVGCNMGPLAKALCSS